MTIYIRQSYMHLQWPGIHLRSSGIMCSILKAFDCVPKPSGWRKKTIELSPKPSQWHREPYRMTLLSVYTNHKPIYTNPKRSGSCPKASDILLKPFDRSPEPSAQLFAYNFKLMIAFYNQVGIGNYDSRLVKTIFHLFIKSPMNL